MSGQVSRRYARAVLKLSSDPAQLETWGGEIESLARIADSPELMPALIDPEITQEQRLQAVAKIAERLSLSFPIRSFALVLTRHGHVGQVSSVSQAYQELLDQQLGRARAVLTFAIEPNAAQVGSVVAELERITGKKVTARVNVDNALLGGVTAELEGKIYDASLATGLEEVGRRLSA